MRLRPPVVAILVMLVAGVLAAFVVMKLTARTDQAVNRVTTVEKQKADKSAVAKTDRTAKTAKRTTDKVARKVERQVIKLDRTITILGKAGLNGLPGKNGKPGPPGKDAVIPFTLQDIIARLPAPVAGPPGADGHDATQDQVDDAVRRLISFALAQSCDGSCKGATGAQGAAGADSTVPGPVGAQGPGPADAQVQAAVDAYCAAHGNCTPPPPPPPPPTQVVCQPPAPDGTQVCTVTG